MIKLHNISFSYNQKPILANFDLDIEQAKSSVLIGPSGSGKSTILRLINGILLPQQGTVSIQNTLLGVDNLREMRLKTGYLIQEGGLFPNMNCRENICLMAGRLKWPANKIGSRVEELLQLTHFDNDLLKQYPSEISGGQRQRVSLMRALFLDPDILLLDEPFGALDPLIRSEIHKSIKAIFDQLKKTVLIVTHDLSEAAYFADRIILLNEGRVIQSGSIEELVKNPAQDFVSTFISAQKSYLPKIQ